MEYILLSLLCVDDCSHKKTLLGVLKESFVLRLSMFSLYNWMLLRLTYEEKAITVYIVYSAHYYNLCLIMNRWNSVANIFETYLIDVYRYMM